MFCVHARGEPTPGDGIREAAWVSRAEALTRLAAPYHAALRDHLEGRGRRHARLDWVEERPDGPDGGDLPRHLLVLAAAAAVGDGALLAREVQSALEGGERAERLVETLLQIVPYAGYPRAISAFHVLRRVLPAAPPAVEAADSGEGRATRGWDVFEAVYGETATAVGAGLEALDPVLKRWTLEHAYGRVLARDSYLTLLERELLAVSTLTALGGLEDPLLGHMRACRRLGASRAQVAGAVHAVPASCGEGRRAAAETLLGRLEPRSSA